MHDLPGSLRLASTFPFVGRAAELADAARAAAARRRRAARRVVLVGGEAGLGQEPARARVRGRGGRRGGALVLYGACDAVVRTPVRPVRRGARAARPGARPGRAARRASAPARRRADAAAPGSPGARRRAAARRSPPTPTPSATACTRPSPTCSPASSARRARCCWCSRTATGPTRRRCCCCATWRARGRRGARLLLLATFRDTEADVPDALAETLADLRRSDDVVRLRLAGLSDEEVDRVRPRAAGARARRRPPSSRTTISDLTGGNPFLRLRALARAGRDRGVVEVAGRRASARARRPSSAPRRACARSSASGSRACAPATSDLLELAAIAGPEFELDVLRARAAPASASCWRRSTRPCAAA